MPGHDIIVIGTSAGGVEALSRLTRGLPRDLPASVFIVMHISDTAPSVLPKILARVTALPVEHPTDGESFAPGHVYVAPPGVHMLIEDTYIRLVAGPRENRHRPAIDPLFRSAALAYGPRVVGVVLTGALNDGTAGLLAIKRQGGIAVTQDPKDALMPSMPASALTYVAIDQSLPLAEIPRYLAQVAREPVATTGEHGEHSEPEDMRMEADIAGLRPNIHMQGDTLGHLSVYTCPDCKGPLWEIHDGQLLRFRCYVGHAFTSDALSVAQAEAIDNALWTALETLEQRADIARSLGASARERLHLMAAQRFDAQASEMREKINVIRQVLMSDGASETPLDEQRESVEGVEGVEGVDERQEPEKQPT